MSGGGFSFQSARVTLLFDAPVMVAIHLDGRVKRWAKCAEK